MRFANRAAGPTLCRAVHAYDCLRRGMGLGRTKEPDGATRKILVIKVAGLGDTVLMLPALQALQGRFPRAEIWALVSPLTDGLLCGQPVVRGCIRYDFFGRDRGWRGFLRIIRRLRREGFDIVVDFEQHFGLIPVIAYATGAPTRSGFVGGHAWRGCLFTHPVPLDGSKHMLEAFLDLSRALGAKPLQDDCAGNLWVSDEDRAFIQRWLADRGVGPTDLVIAIHPGPSTHQHKRWAPENFSLVADKLVVECTATVVLTGGPDEGEIIRQVTAGMQQAPLVAVGEFTVPQLAALIERCALFLGNDTGPMHIGPAVGTPTLGLFGPELPLRYRPYGSGHVAIHHPLECSPCINIHLGPGGGCVNPDRYLCMKLITVERIWKEAQAMLETVLTAGPEGRGSQDEDGGAARRREREA